MKNQLNLMYVAPECNTLEMQIENAIMASSLEKPGSSLGQLDDNNVFGEDFI